MALLWNAIAPIAAGRGPGGVRPRARRAIAAPAHPGTFGQWRLRQEL